MVIHLKILILLFIHPNLSLRTKIKIKIRISIKREMGKIWGKIRLGNSLLDIWLMGLRRNEDWMGCLLWFCLFFIYLLILYKILSINKTNIRSFLIFQSASQGNNLISGPGSGKLLSLTSIFVPKLAFCCYF